MPTCVPNEAVHVVDIVGFTCSPSASDPNHWPCCSVLFAAGGNSNPREILCFARSLNLVVRVPSIGSYCCSLTKALEREAEAAFSPATSQHWRRQRQQVYAKCSAQQLPLIGRHSRAAASCCFGIRRAELAAATLLESKLDT